MTQYRPMDSTSGDRLSHAMQIEHFSDPISFMLQVALLLLLLFIYVRIDRRCSQIVWRFAKNCLWICKRNSFPKWDKALRHWAWVLLHNPFLKNNRKTSLTTLNSEKKKNVTLTKLDLLFSLRRFQKLQFLLDDQTYRLLKFIADLWILNF